MNARRKWFRSQRDVRVGDAVMILSTDMSRGKWKLGRIAETYPGKDGHVRVVKLRSNDGEYVRPISKICPLECEKDVM